MNLTRALSAVLALSLLTACDITALMPDFNKKPGTLPGGDDQTTAPVELTAEEKAQFETYTTEALGASAESMAAVTAINALKSVAAFGSAPSGYRTSAITFPEGVTWQANYTHERFTGSYGTKTNEYYMDGTFNIKSGVTSTGKASLLTNQKPSFDTMDTFRATASVEVKMGTVPASENAMLKSLAGADIKVDLKKDQPGIDPTLMGTYEITGGGGILNGTGKLEVDILKNAWTVEKGNTSWAMRMTFEPNGAGQGTLYATMNPGMTTVVNYDQKLGTMSWGEDGRGTMVIQGKSQDIRMF